MQGAVRLCVAADAIPGSAEAGTGRFVSVGHLPGAAVRHMLGFVENVHGTAGV